MQQAVGDPGQAIKQRRHKVQQVATLSERTKPRIPSVDFNYEQCRVTYLKQSAKDDGRNLVHVRDESVHK